MLASSAFDRVYLSEDLLVTFVNGNITVILQILQCRSRQWPEVYDLCHSCLHVARVKQHARFSHGRVLFDSRNVQKRATKSDTSGHCLCRSTAANAS